MDTRLLRTFHAVVEHGSFTSAATALGYTQSAVSQHVAALEASLGVELFRRRPFALTPAAVRLAEHAGNILMRLDVATSELRAVDSSQPVRVIATPLGAAGAPVAALLTAAGGGRRGSHVAIASARDALEAVARGAADGAFVDGIVGPADPLALADPGLVTSMLVQIAPMAVMLPSDHPLASRSGLAWSAVADAQWLDAPAIAPTMAPGAAQLLHRRTNGTVYDGHDAETIVSLVARGHGLALVPQWWPTERAEVRCVVVREPPLVHRVELVVLRSRAEEWSQHLDPHAPPAHA